MSSTRILKVMALAAAVIMIAACGKKEVVKPSEESVRATEAMKALSGMREAYLARDMDGVLKHVSPELKNGYAEFLTSLRKDMEAHDRVELEMTVDRAEIKGETTRVVFHWHGRWHDRQGAAREGRGNSVFSFSGSPMSLHEVVGDSPFGVIR